MYYVIAWKHILIFLDNIFIDLFDLWVLNFYVAVCHNTIFVSFFLLTTFGIVSIFFIRWFLRCHAVIIHNLVSGIMCKQKVVKTTYHLETHIIFILQFLLKFWLWLANVIFQDMTILIFIASSHRYNHFLHFISRFIVLLKAEARIKTNRPFILFKPFKFFFFFLYLRLLDLRTRLYEFVFVVAVHS